jgi:hypothetical protein
MTETALQYEYIIRNAHQVGRLGIPAAHADTFRGLERSFIRQRDNKDIEKNDELLFEYASNCGEVVTNLNNAINAFEKRFDGKLTDQDKEELNDIEDLLINGKMDEIDKSIELIQKVFKRHGLIA